MKATTEVTICGAEGLGDDLSSVGCYVSLDGRLHDVITPLNNTPGPDTAVLLPQDGELRLIVKNMGGDDHVFGSVSLPLSLLPSDPGQLWLPLFERLDGDLLHSLPETVDSPKILLIIGTVNLLSPVQELTEGSRSSIDDLEDFQQGMLSQRTSVEVGRVFDTPGRAKISQLEHQLEKSNLRFRVSAEEAQKELQMLILKHSQAQENWQSLFQRQQLLTQDLTSQVSGLQKLYNQEQVRAETLTARLNTLNEEYEASQERMIEREKTLMETVDEKVTQASNLQVQIAELQESLRNATSDKFQLEELYKQLQVQLESGSVAEVQDSLTLAVEQLAESEIARKRLQDELNRSIQIPEKSEIEKEGKTDEALNEGLVKEIERLHDRMIVLETLLAEKEEKEFLLTTDLKNQRNLEEALKRCTDDLCKTKETVAVLSRENESIKSDLSTLTSLLEDSHAKHAELQATVSGLRLENDTLAYDLEESKKRPLKSGEVVDFLLGRYFSEKGVSVPLQKITDELFSIGSRRFSLVLKNAAVVAKVGNGTLLLDDFFRIYMPSDSRHFETQMSESTLTPLSSHSHTKSSNRSMSVESKNHRRVNTMPETVSEVSHPKQLDQDEEVTSTNTSEIRRGFDSENVPESANHMEDSYTPSPNKKVLHGVNQARSNKTPKTPGHRGTSAPKSGKSVDRAARKAPFR